jgi:hypothetical protein
MKMIKIIKWVGVVFLIFVLALGLVGCSGGLGYNPPATGGIAGTVKDEADVIIVGATVVVEEADLSAITDADGYYTLENIPAGTYNVATFADNHYPQTATVTVEKGKTIIQDFTTQAIQIHTIYDLTISSTEGGSVTEPGEGTFTYDAGMVVDLVATLDADYRFVEWTGDVGTIADVNAAATTITMNGDYSITANFVAIYNLAISSTEGGSITEPSEGTFTYDAGTVVDLVATPDDGYRFVEWTGDVGTIADVNAAATTITMNGDYSITANFVAIYDLTISSTEGGSVTEPGEGTFTYDAGTVVDLVATPDDGYRFVEWTGDVSTIGDVTAAATDITMSGNYSITASFAMEATPVSVESITYATRGGHNQHLDIIVTLVDDLDNPVVGANVSATLYRDDGESWNRQGTTNSNGSVTFQLNNHGIGCYWMVVTDVQAEGLEWDGATPENGYCKG